MTTKSKHGAVLAGPFLERLVGPLTLGGFLNAIRTGEGWSLAEMGARLGVSRMHLCDVEKGRRPVAPGRAAEWARLLGYSPEQFVSLALQEQVLAAGLNMDVEVTAHKRSRTSGRRQVVGR